MSDVFDEARAERARAHAKHGDTSMESMPADDPTGRRYRILVEEIGEVAQEFNDAEHDRRPVDLAALRKELIQVAAMAGAWADACGPGPVECTGSTATWCPIHGDCNCQREPDGEPDFVGGEHSCPLHAINSPHAEDEPDDHVVDLMAALEESVAAAKRAREQQP